MKKTLSRLTKGPLAALFVAAVFALTFTLAACEEGGEIKTEEDEAVSGAGELFGEVVPEATPAPVVTPEQLMANNNATVDNLKVIIELLKKQIEEAKIKVEQAGAEKADEAAKEAAAAEVKALEAKQKEIAKLGEELADLNKKYKEQLEDQAKAMAEKEATEAGTIAKDIVEDIELTFMTATYGKDADLSSTNGHFTMSFCKDSEFKDCKVVEIPYQCNSNARFCDEGVVNRVTGTKDLPTFRSDGFTEDYFNYVRWESDNDDDYLPSGIRIDAKIDGKQKTEYLNIAPMVWITTDYGKKDLKLSKDDVGIFIKYKVADEDAATDDGAYLIYFEPKVEPKTSYLFNNIITVINSRLTDDKTPNLKVIDLTEEETGVFDVVDPLAVKYRVSLYLNSQYKDQDPKGEFEAYGNFAFDFLKGAALPFDKKDKNKIVVRLSKNIPNIADESIEGASFSDVEIFVYFPGRSEFLNDGKCYYYKMAADDKPISIDPDEAEVDEYDFETFKLPLDTGCLAAMKYLTLESEGSNGDLYKNIFGAQYIPDAQAKTVEPAAPATPDPVETYRTENRSEATEHNTATNKAAANVLHKFGMIQSGVTACEASQTQDQTTLDKKKQWEMGVIDATIIDLKARIALMISNIAFEDFNFKKALKNVEDAFKTLTDQFDITRDLSIQIDKLFNDLGAAYSCAPASQPAGPGVTPGSRTDPAEGTLQ